MSFPAILFFAFTSFTAVAFATSYIHEGFGGQPIWVRAVCALVVGIVSVVAVLGLVGLAAVSKWLFP